MAWSLWMFHSAEPGRDSPLVPVTAGLSCRSFKKDLRPAAAWRLMLRQELLRGNVIGIANQHASHDRIGMRLKHTDDQVYAEFGDVVKAKHKHRQLGNVVIQLCLIF